MLTPAIDDANRKAELKRKSQNPFAFGVPRLDKRAAEERSLTGHILVAPADADVLTAPKEVDDAQTAADKLAAEELAAAEAARIRKEWEEYLDQPVKVLINELPAVQSVDQLTVMSEVEAATKNRKHLIEAIATEIANRGE